MDNITEKQNSKSKKIDILSTFEILSIINEEDEKIANVITIERSPSLRDKLCTLCPLPLVDFSSTIRIFDKSFGKKLIIQK